MGVIAALAKGGFPVEATRVFAHALPKREAVWWACMCAGHTAPAEPAAADTKARELAEIWVRQQTDEIRRAAMDEAKKAGFQSPEAWAAVAAFWSAGSLAPQPRRRWRRQPILPGSPSPGQWRWPRSAARLAARSSGLRCFCSRHMISPTAVLAGYRWRQHDPYPQRVALSGRGAPETKRVTGGEFRIGRAADNDWVMPDAERTLSKKHCVVAFRNGGWAIADTSTNGTFLNRDQDPIGQGQIRGLQNGDRIRFGAYEIEVRIEQEQGSGAGYGSGFGGKTASPFDDPFGDDVFAPKPPPQDNFTNAAFGNDPLFGAARHPADP